MTTVAQDKAEIRCFHDGDCPLCRREVRLMRRLDSHNRVDWIDLNSRHPAMEAAGISREQAMAALHVVGPDGRVVSGVPAFLMIWERLPYYRRMAALVRRIPWLISLLEVGYTVFARFRPRLVLFSGRRRRT